MRNRVLVVAEGQLPRMTSREVRVDRTADALALVTAIRPSVVVVGAPNAARGLRAVSALRRLAPAATILVVDESFLNLRGQRYIAAGADFYGDMRDVVGLRLVIEKAVSRRRRLPSAPQVLH